MAPSEVFEDASQHHVPVDEPTTSPAAPDATHEDRPTWIPPVDGILEGPALSLPLSDESLGVVLLRRMHAHGDQNALVDAVNGTETTYRSLVTECVRLARALRTLVKDIHSGNPLPQVVNGRGGKTRRFADGKRFGARDAGDWSKSLREGRGSRAGIQLDGARVDPGPASQQPLASDERDGEEIVSPTAEAGSSSTARVDVAAEDQEEKFVVGVFSENRKEVVQSLVASLLIGVPVTMLSPFSNTGELVRTWSVTHPSLAMCSWGTFHAVLEASRSLPSLRHIVVFPGEVPDDVKEAAATDKSWGVQVSQLDQLLERVEDTHGEPLDLDATLRDVAVAVRPEDHCAFLLQCDRASRVARLTHRNFLYAVQLLQEPGAGYGWTSADVVLLTVPLTHALGLGVCLGILALGAQAVLMPAFSEQLFLAAIHGYSVSQLVLAPPQAALLAHSALLDGVRGLSGVVCAAGPLPRALHRDLARRLRLSEGAQPRQAYGLTQAACSLVLTPRGSPPDTQGKLAPGAQAKVVDADTGETVPPLHVGELLLRAPSIMAGYYLDEEATREVLDEQGWLRSGDLAYYDHNGYLFVVDRLKDVMMYTKVHFKEFTTNAGKGDEAEKK